MKCKYCGQEKSAPVHEPLLAMGCHEYARQGKTECFECGGEGCEECDGLDRIAHCDLAARESAVNQTAKL